MQNNNSPSEMLHAYRKSDAVLILCQNNTLKKIEIAALSEEASKLTGYTNEDVLGQPFATLLPARINNILEEFIEYRDQDGNDLLAVLQKVRQFSLKSKNGQEIEYHFRIVRGEAIDRNPCFYLVLSDENKSRNVNTFRAVLKENFKGHEVINSDTGLPDRQSLLSDLELVVHSVRNKNITASFAAIDINDYEHNETVLGRSGCNELHYFIGELCKNKLRPEDTVGSLSERTLGVLLVDSPQEPSRMVLNRLRWAIGASVCKIQGAEVSPQVNIGFAEIDAAIKEATLVETVENFMLDLRKKTRNSLHLVVTHERRNIVDRRKIDIQVEIERRRQERRNS